jgi:hypothetical protein
LVLLFDLTREYKNNLISLAVQPLNQFEDTYLDPPEWWEGKEMSDYEDESAARIQFETLAAGKA